MKKIKMVLVLCIGDANVPRARGDIPLELKKLLQPGKIQEIICTGNIGDEKTMDFLKSVTNRMTVVQGDGFVDAGGLDQVRVVDIEGFRVGVIHGYQIVPGEDKDAVGIVQRRLGVDILVKGNAKSFGAYSNEGCMVIQPGSATGTCMDAHGTVGKPSYALMDLKGSKATVYVYQLDEETGHVEVEKIQFSKADP